MKKPKKKSSLLLYKTLQGTWDTLLRTSLSIA